MIMRLAQTTAARETILAGNLGKYKSVACQLAKINAHSFVKLPASLRTVHYLRTTTSTGLDGRMLPLPSVPSTEKAW
jgi:hypothetical protein